MIQKTGLTDTYELSYYQKNSYATVTLRKGDDGGLNRINEDGTETSLYRYEASVVSSAPIPCENYNDIKSRMAEMPLLSWNKLFHETDDVMKEYYSGCRTADEVVAYVKKTCSFNNVSKERISKALSTMYEHISRANAQYAAENNYREAEQLYIKTGLRQDAGDYYSNLKGGMYYNADYYYAYSDMQSLVKNTLNELADQYGIDRPDYDAIDKSGTFIDGGITYNGVWNQKTINIYRGLDDSGVIANDFVPSRSFLFCEARADLRGYSNLDDLKAIIEGYVSKNIRKGESNGNHALVTELQRNSHYDNSLREGKARLHNYLNSNGIPLKNPDDRNWIMDYFGMAML